MKNNSNASAPRGKRGFNHHLVIAIATIIGLASFFFLINSFVSYCDFTVIELHNSCTVIDNWLEIYTSHSIDIWRRIPMEEIRRQAMTMYFHKVVAGMAISGFLLVASIVAIIVSNHLDNKQEGKA